MVGHKYLLIMCEILALIHTKLQDILVIEVHVVPGQAEWNLLQNLGVSVGRV